MALNSEGSAGAGADTGVCVAGRDAREGGGRDAREGGGSGRALDGGRNDPPVRDGGGGRAETRAAGLGDGIPGLNGIVRGGGSGALMRPARGAAGEVGVLVADRSSLPARAFWLLLSSLMVLEDTLLHPRCMTPVVCAQPTARSANHEVDQAFEQVGV